MRKVMLHKFYKRKVTLRKVMLLLQKWHFKDSSIEKCYFRYNSEEKNTSEKIVRKKNDSSMRNALFIKLPQTFMQKVKFNYMTPIKKHKQIVE